MIYMIFQAFADHKDRLQNKSDVRGLQVEI